MAKKLNGTWKVIATIGGFLIVIVGAAITYGALHEKVVKMEPDVAKNNEHRIRFEERVSNMDIKIDKILEEVQKE